MRTTLLPEVLTRPSSTDEQRVLGEREREGRMEIALVVLGVVIVALLWRLISAVERIEDEIVATRRSPAADPRSGDRRGT